MSNTLQFGEIYTWKMEAPIKVYTTTIPPTPTWKGKFCIYSMFHLLKTKIWTWVKRNRTVALQQSLQAFFLSFCWCSLLLPPPLTEAEEALERRELRARPLGSAGKGPPRVGLRRLEGTEAAAPTPMAGAGAAPDGGGRRTTNEHQG